MDELDERPRFGSVLKRLRLTAGLTREALAERAGLGARTLSDLERGVSRAPRTDTLALLIDALALSPEQRAELERAARPPRDLSNPPAATASTLPLHLTSFVGREVDAVRTRAACPARCPSGHTHRTRRGRQNAALVPLVAGLDDRFPGGVRLVDLDAITDPEGADDWPRARDDGGSPGLGEERVITLVRARRRCWCSTTSST